MEVEEEGAAGQCCNTDKSSVDEENVGRLGWGREVRLFGLCREHWLDGAAERAVCKSTTPDFTD